MGTVAAALGARWLLAVIGLLVWTVTTSAERDDTGSVVEAGGESAFELDTGDCLETVAEDVELMSVPLVPCNQPHDGEVYATASLPGEECPGDEALFAAAESACISRFAAFLGIRYEESVQELFYLHPTRRSWTVADDRGVVCVLVSDDSVGTAQGSQR